MSELLVFAIIGALIVVVLVLWAAAALAGYADEATGRDEGLRR